MRRLFLLSIFATAFLMLATSNACAQPRRTAYIGYVYPAGGQQGSTFSIRLGGQRLDGLRDAVVSGEGVSARLVEYHRRLNNQDVQLLREQLRLLRPRRGQGAQGSRRGQGAKVTPGAKAAKGAKAAPRVLSRAALARKWSRRREKAVARRIARAAKSSGSRPHPG